MAYEPIIRATPEHLSPRPVDAILTAWLNDNDVQAIRQGDVESLMIGTKVINLDARIHHHPTQQVINLAMLKKRKRAELIKSLLSL